jgi:hypothetical protein
MLKSIQLESSAQPTPSLPAPQIPMPSGTYPFFYLPVSLSPLFHRQVNEHLSSSPFPKYQFVDSQDVNSLIEAAAFGITLSDFQN